MELELISFKVCPFVQRSVITLLYKDVPFKITYIDLMKPPEWFRQISPLGKVPLLKVGDQAVLFESAVINEYLDETTLPRLHPDDPLRRAHNRAWIEFGSTCLMDLFNLSVAGDKAKFEECSSSLVKKIDRLEGELVFAPYFNGERFSLADAAFAPLLMRLELLNQVHEVYSSSTHPKLRTWSETLMDMPAVKKSVVHDFVKIYFDHIRSRGGYLAGLLAGA